MDKSDVTNLLSQSVAVITEKLSALDRATLVELQAQEAAAGNRVTLIKAIEDRLVALDADGDGGTDKPNLPAVGDKGAPAAEAAGKPAPITTKHWQHPDYAGALNGEQAAWRVANIKPVREARTK